MPKKRSKKRKYTFTAARKKALAKARAARKKSNNPTIKKGSTMARKKRRNNPKRSNPIASYRRSNNTGMVMRRLQDAAWVGGGAAISGVITNMIPAPQNIRPWVPLVSGIAMAGMLPNRQARLMAMGVSAMGVLAVAQQFLPAGTIPAPMSGKYNARYVKPYMGIPARFGIPAEWGTPGETAMAGGMTYTDYKTPADL